jgi:hypothetical protein
MTYCTHCMDKTETHNEDIGFFYEYGSERSYHFQYETVCSKCSGEDVVELDDDYDAKVIARYQLRFKTIPKRIIR